MVPSGLLQSRSIINGPVVPTMVQSFDACLWQLAHSFSLLRCTASRAVVLNWLRDPQAPQECEFQPVGMNRGPLSCV